MVELSTSQATLEKEEGQQQQQKHQQLEFGLEKLPNKLRVLTESTTANKTAPAARSVPIFNCGVAGQHNQLAQSEPAFWGKELHHSTTTHEHICTQPKVANNVNPLYTNHSDLLITRDALTTTTNITTTSTITTLPITNHKTAPKHHTLTKTISDNAPSEIVSYTNSENYIGCKHINFTPSNTNNIKLESVLFNESLIIDAHLNDKIEQKNHANKTLQNNFNLGSVVNENTKLSLIVEQKSEDATLSADCQCLHLEHLNHQQGSHSLPVTQQNTQLDSNESEQKLGYQLRALSDKTAALEANPWIQTTELTQNLHAPSLSTELVNETLNYFVNCRQRINQMTKTYDDNDAYILLLQEKEVDLELAARIGQDLLKQNKQLKDSIKSLQDELAKRQDDVQQLRHELASKISLLDTFIEEEEHHNAVTRDCADGEDEQLSIRYQQHSTPKPGTSNQHNKNHLQLPKSVPTPALSNVVDEDGANGFLSLNYNQQKPTSFLVEPFSSLPYQVNNTHQSNDTKQQLTQDDLSHHIGDDIDHCNNKATSDTQRLVENVTFQLVESNKRLCELQDELLFKGEQSLLQQEKIFRLEEQLRESDRRLDDVASENESLRKSILQSSENQQELYDELKICKRNFSELLRVFLELQRESRINRNLQQNSNVTQFYGEIDPVIDINNISFDSFADAPPPFDAHSSATINDFNLHSSCHHQQYTDSTSSHDDIHAQATISMQQAIRRQQVRCGGMVMSSSLHEELRESMQKNGDLHEDDDDELLTSNHNQNHDSDGAASDGADSGLHTTNVSSGTPSNNGLSADTDTEDAFTGSATSQDDSSKSKKHWLGFSSFMLTTLLLLCISATFTSSANSNLAQRLQIKLDR